MPRATNSPASRARRKRVIKASKGYRGRKTRKRNFRALWITRLSAAVRAEGISYNRFIEGLKAAGISLDRKVLSDIALQDGASFKQIVEKAKSAYGEKAKQTAQAA